LDYGSRDSRQRWDVCQSCKQFQRDQQTGKPKLQDQCRTSKSSCRCIPSWSQLATESDRTADPGRAGIVVTEETKPIVADKISTTLVAENRQNRAYRGIWLKDQKRQPPFFTTHPESILTFDRKKCDFRAGLTTPASRIRLSQERLGARKADNLDDFEGRRNGFESLDLDFEGFGPSNRTILGKRQPLFFTPREKLTPNLTIFVALARLEYVFGP